ncbi:MAG TPA: hypothetical protein VFY16_09245 [Gemmatimonadaceae bacterium]|nr:hypothetical protein [Gemmatimonadaceae bacterium]
MLVPSHPSGVRVVLAGLSLVSILACAGQAPARRAAIENHHVPACADSEVVARADSAEPAALTGTGGRVVRTGCVLLVRTASGRAVALTDDYTEGDRFVQHVYRGSLPPRQLDVVEVARYEGGGYLVLDRNGAQTWIARAPVASPDGRRFVALSFDLEAGYQPNVIEVWRVEDGSPRLEIAVRSDDWGPSDARWRDNATITFVQNFPRYTDEGYGYDRRPVRLVRRARGWMLEQDAH